MGGSAHLSSPFRYRDLSWRERSVIVTDDRSEKLTGIGSDWPNGTCPSPGGRHLTRTRSGYVDPLLSHHRIPRRVTSGSPPLVAPSPLFAAHDPQDSRNDARPGWPGIGVVTEMLAAAYGRRRPPRPGRASAGNGDLRAGPHEGPFFAGRRAANRENGAQRRIGHPKKRFIRLRNYFKNSALQ